MSDIRDSIEMARQFSSSASKSDGLPDSLHLMGVLVGTLDTSHARTVEGYCRHLGKVLLFAMDADDRIPRLELEAVGLKHRNEELRECVRVIAAELGHSAVRVISESGGHLPSNGDDSLVGKPLEDVERYYVRKALELTGGRRDEAAKMLGMGERTLYRKLKEWGAHSWGEQAADESEAERMANSPDVTTGTTDEF